LRHGARVELFSATDPVYVPHRQVWYWTEFLGLRSERLTDWATVAAHAEAIRSEHEAVLIDRSDKGSGFLLSTLG
jgi:hypothetical protein